MTVDSSSTITNDEETLNNFPDSKAAFNAYLIVPNPGAKGALYGLKEPLVSYGCKFSSLPHNKWVCPKSSKDKVSAFLETQKVSVSYREIFFEYFGKSKDKKKIDDDWAKIIRLEEQNEKEKRDLDVEENRLEKEIFTRNLSSLDESVLAKKEEFTKRRIKLNQTRDQIDQMRNSIRILEENSPTSPIQRKLQAVTLSDFLKAEIPPRKLLLSPWLPESGVCMIYAKAGIGKTFLALSAAYAVASGSGLLKCESGNLWKAEKPEKVLLVDGEMPQFVLQERLGKLIPSFNRELPSEDYFRIINPDRQDSNESIRGIPDIQTSDGQRAIEDILGDSKLLILDNLSSLTRSCRENDAETYAELQEWFLSLRKQGKTVLVVHHASKGLVEGKSNFRGHSKLIDIMDTAMSLERPKGYAPDHGCVFEVHYLKNRGFFGADAEPFQVTLTPCNGVFEWSYQRIEKVKYLQLVELYQDGMTNQRQLADELGIGLGSVNRYIQRAKAEGEIL